MIDFTDSHKHPVHVNDSVILVQQCKNGCPPDNLYVVIQDVSNDCYTHAMVCIGCVFCGHKVHRAKIESALDAWATHQVK